MLEGSIQARGVDTIGLQTKGGKGQNQGRVGRPTKSVPRTRVDINSYRNQERAAECNTMRNSSTINTYYSNSDLQTICIFVHMWLKNTSI